MNQWNYKNFEVFESEIKSKKNQTWNKCGGDQTGKVKGGYRFNELGFRGDDIEIYESSSKKLLTFGCSHTFGVGVGNDETWPHILAEKINHSHINFGIQGCSNDTISRAVLSFTQRFKPNIVVILWTYLHRREYVNKDGKRCFYKPNGKWDFWDTKEGSKIHEKITFIQNDEYDMDNYYRNHMLVSSFLKTIEVPVIHFNIEDYKMYWKDFGVDGNHAGVESHQDFVKKIKQNYLSIQS